MPVVSYLTPNGRVVDASETTIAVRMTRAMLDASLRALFDQRERGDDEVRSMEELMDGFAELTDEEWLG